MQPDEKFYEEIHKRLAIAFDCIMQVAVKSVDEPYRNRVLEKSGEAAMMIGGAAAIHAGGLKTAESLANRLRAVLPVIDRQLTGEAVESGIVERAPSREECARITAPYREISDAQTLAGIEEEHRAFALLALGAAMLLVSCDGDEVSAANAVVLLADLTRAGGLPNLIDIPWEGDPMH